MAKRRETAILDDMGFVKENEYIVVSFPMFRGILAYRVMARVNKGFEKINYGALPIPTAVPWAARTGLVPANSNSGPFPWPWAVLPAERQTDMWWFDNNDKLVSSRWKISPYMLRNFLFLAVGTQEIVYLGIATADATMPSDFGYWRGTLELPILPYMHMQMSCFNMTNMDLLADVSFEYAEYAIELIRDPQLLWELMTRRKRAHWQTYPGEIRIPTDPFVRAYHIQQPIPLSRNLDEVRRSVMEFMGR